MTMTTATKEAPKAAPTPKATKPAAPKAGTNGTAPAPEKKGLRKPQVRILAYLAKQTSPVPRKEVAAGAPVDVANCVELIGSHDDDVRKANDVKHYPSLLTLGFVKAKEVLGEVNGKETRGIGYTITPLGRKALEKAQKAEAAAAAK